MAANGETGQEPSAARGPRASAAWLPPLALSALVVALAPFVGVLVGWVRETVGLGYLLWVSVALAAAAGGAFLWALIRIRERRAIRYGLLGLAGLLVALQVFGWGTGKAEVDTVERVHLLEYGLLGALFERAFRRRHADLSLPVLTLAAVALVGLADEGVQWLSPVRVGDGRDVVLNVWAGGIGYLFAVALSRDQGRLRRPDAASRRLSAVLGAVLAVAAGVFVDTAHLGHEIRDPGAGAFLSWHAPEELVREAAERRRRWSEGERPVLRPLEREDVFLTEAGWHAAARNEAATRGDVLLAWRENRILERWFAPYLELPGAAWPAAQRRNVRRAVEEQLGGDRALETGAAGYRSPVLRGRVLAAPPRSLLWAGVSALAVLLGWRACRRPRGTWPPSPKRVRSDRP